MKSLFRRPVVWLALPLLALPLLLAGPAQAARHPAPAKAKIKARAKAKAEAEAKAEAKPKLVKKTPPRAPRPEPAALRGYFSQWKEVGDFLDEVAAKHGFERATLQTLIDQVRYVDTTVQLMKPQPPGKPKNWQAYRQRFVEPVRLQAGLAFWREHADALARAESQFGVPADIIVGIIGVETVYGRNPGRFRVLDALTTLAFAYPDSANRVARMAFFRGELENTLLLARQNDIDPLSLLGSYAGAVGMPQFMPSNIIKFGLDFDGDGQVDLRGSATDAIGSVANFLIQHGWRRDDPRQAVYPAIVSPDRSWEPFLNQGLEAKFSAEDLLAGGVSASAAIPAGGLFGLIDLQNAGDPTEFCLATNNFFAITQYNRSYFYAMSVIELGQAVRQARDNLSGM
ncbi:MAG: lytic murein transglycosylase B [Pseudomonadota bacterium]